MREAYGLFPIEAQAVPLGETILHAGRNVFGVLLSNIIVEVC